MLWGCRRNMIKGNPERNIQQEKNARKELKQSCSSRPPSGSKAENVIGRVAHKQFHPRPPKPTWSAVLRAIFEYDAQ